MYSNSSANGRNFTVGIQGFSRRKIDILDIDYRDGKELKNGLSFIFQIMYVY